MENGQDVDFDEVEADDSSHAQGDPSSAPYMPYRGFSNLIDKFQDQPLPAVFDTSYFGNISGSTRAQIRGTLRYFELIDEDYRPTVRLQALVTLAPDARRGELHALATEKYPDILSLDTNATSGQLAEKFRQRGLSGATIAKAISFYLTMAEDVGIPVSPHFKKGRSAGTASASPRKRRSKASGQTPPPQGPPMETPVIATKDAQKADYIAMLMDLARSGESAAQPDLLDRIEKMLSD